MSRLIVIIICCFVLVLSTDAQEYTVNPGDTLLISVLGDETLSTTVTVGASGYIMLPPPIGTVKVAGLTTTEIARLLEERLGKHIRTPIVFVSVKPSEGFVVHLLGEVRSPNFYTVPEGTSLQEVITRAGGLTELADLKHVRLIRKYVDENQQQQLQEQTVDYSEFVELNNMNANPTLENQDIIFIPRLSYKEYASQKVSILGAVQTPGVHRLKEPLPLIEVLSLAGGGADDADLARVSIIEMQGGQYVWHQVAFEKFLSGDDKNANLLISPGMVVWVPKMEKEKPLTVTVVGQVQNGGVFPMAEGARLFEAIYTAGGLSPEAALNRIMLLRSDAQSPALQTFDITKYLMSGDLNSNPILKHGDTVFVPMSTGVKQVSSIHTPFFESIRVSIMGEVTKPGDYQVASNATVLDLVKLAEGTTADADLKRVLLIREQPEEEQGFDTGFDTPSATQPTASATLPKRLEINLKRVLQEGNLKLLPPLLAGDIIFIPLKQPKMGFWGVWRGIVKIAADVSTVVIAYFLITGKRTVK